MPPLIRGLMRPEAYDHPVSGFQLLETHISWIILTGQFAYKLKKPVNLGFVDFTTLELRRHFCEEEIRLNSRFAPELYLGVRPIYGTTSEPSFQGSGAPLEFAVQLRQFDQAQLLPAVLQRGALRSDHIDRLAVTLAEFHDRAAVAEKESPWGTPEAVRVPFDANFQSLESTDLANRRIAALKLWSDAEFERRKDWFQQRHDTGRIRECHGDLHLGNLVLLDDEIRLFDGLEFNPGLRWIDVISEIAFLVMDFEERGRPDFAFQVLNCWLEHSGDYEGLTGWRWYLIYRALVRAKVAALRLQQSDIASDERLAKQDELTKYVELADRTLRNRLTPLIVMHGFSGSGKSHVAQFLCQRFGAIQLRSDVERKRMFGKWGAPAETTRTGDLYAPEVTRKLYEQVLAGLSPGILAAGFPVVIDAACLRRGQRALFHDLATKLRVPFLIVDVQARVETLERRLLQRNQEGCDPSDADHAVLDRQLADHEPLSSEELAISLPVGTETTTWQDDLTRELSRRFFSGPESA